MRASKNIFVVMGSVVVVLLLLGAAAMLGVGAWRLAKSEAKLKRLKGDWRRFYEQNDPFPSRENVLKEKKNNETIDFWFAELMKELRKDQIVPGKSKSASAFGDDLGRERDKMRALAVAKGVSIPDGFAFGFDRYLSGRGAVLPSAENVPYLRQQLETIERLYSLMIESDVKAIVSVEREEFDAATEGPSASVPSGGPAVAAGTGEEGLGKPGTVHGEALYGKLHFAFVFKARENTVWDVLNCLAKQDMIIVVTSIQVDGEGLDVVKVALPTAAEKDGGGEAEEAVTKATPRGGLLARKAAERAAAAAAEKAKEKSKVKETVSRIPSRQERVICGPSKAAPARVRIELDVYRFKEE